MRLIKRTFLLGFILSSALTGAYAETNAKHEVKNDVKNKVKIVNKTFIGEFSMRKNNSAVLEALPSDELKKQLPKLKFNRNYSQGDLYIDFSKVSAEEKDSIVKGCNDGQICKIVAGVSKISNNESEKFSLERLKRVQVLKSDSEE